MLADIFEAMQAHPALSGTPQVLGEAQDLTQVPRICWAWGKPGDKFITDGHLLSRSVVVAGVHKHAEGVATRAAGCELRIYVEAGPLPKHLRALEELIRVAVVTLHEVCRGFGNLELGEGRGMDRDSVADGEMGYVLPFWVRVPTYRLTPAADCQSVSVTRMEPR